MELRINDIQLPDSISFNYAEIKAELTEKIKKYETLVYTEAEIKDAKKDRADLNKLKKALDDERKRLEKEYLQPFKLFKARIDELISIIDKPVGLIDKQIKEDEKRKKEEKKAAIREVFERAIHPEWLDFDLMFKEDWLKSSYSMSHIEKQVIPDNIALHVRNAETLANLPEFGFEALEVYKKSLNMTEALNKAKEMSEIAKKKAGTVITEIRLTDSDKNITVSKVNVIAENSEWINFSALLTRSQALELKNFFDTRNIKIKPI